MMTIINGITVYGSPEEINEIIKLNSSATAPNNGVLKAQTDWRLCGTYMIKEPYSASEIAAKSGI